MASLGYTYPSNLGRTSTTTLVISTVILSDLLVQAGAENARFRAQMRFEHLHTIVFVKLLNRIVRNRVFQIAEDARLGRTNFNARRFYSAGDAVIAQRALLGGFGDRIQETAAVGTGLDAKAAADAVFQINQHGAVGRLEGGADRTHPHTKGVFTEIAQLRDEERVLDLILRQERVGETVHPAVGRIHQRLAPGLSRARFRLGDDVTLNPGAKVRPLRHAVFPLARLHAKPAADALVGINAHQPFMLGRVVAIGRTGGNKDFLHHRFGGARG